MEMVDILLPPTFENSHKSKTIEQAWNDEDWIGTFNLWIIQSDPVPSIIYQLRSPNSNWAPMKLDVTAGGHYSAGENIEDGLREVREELGKTYDFNKLVNLGRKVHISPDTKNRERHNVVHIFMTVDNSPLENYVLQKSEVHAIVSCPINELIKVHTQDYSFVAKGLDTEKKSFEIKVDKDSFPYNWDNYHFKIALLTDRLIKGDKNLIY
ncbi:MAG: NUDIX domain-containing protein [Candidatus Shapirobacteria bacterium]